MIKQWFKKVFKQHNNINKEEPQQFTNTPDFAKLPDPEDEIDDGLEEHKELLHEVLRNNIRESIKYMVFDPKINFHEDQNMLILHLNMLYFDYIIDDIDPEILIEIEETVRYEMNEHINQKASEKDITEILLN